MKRENLQFKKQFAALFILVLLGMFTHLQAQTQITGTVIGHEGSWDGTNGLVFSAFDGDLNTFIDGPPTIGWVGYDFGESDVPVITTWKFAPRSGFVDRMNGTQLRGSNNANFLNIYDVLFTIEGDPVDTVLTEAAINASKAYRFVYWYGNIWSYSNISEFELYDADGEVTGTIMGQEESWDGVNGFPIEAFDKDLTTFVDGAEGFGWAGFDFGEGNTANIVSWKYAPRPDWADRLNGTQLRGSNHPNYLNNYTVLDTLVGAPPVGELSESVVNAAENYRFVYWYGPKGSYANIAEIEMYGTVETVSSTKKITMRDVKVYPNPSRGGNINIDLEDLNVDSKVNVKMFDLVGKMVLNREFDASLKTIEINQNLEPGIYFLQIDNSASSKFIVK